MRSIRTPLASLMALLMAQSARAQAPATPAPIAGPTIVRLDVLAPLGMNLGYNLFADRAFLFPILVSYERRVGASWSLGVEGLLNGGTPEEKLAGATLSGRYYLRSDASLSGLYAAPQLAYRRFECKEEQYARVSTTGHRLGTGLLLGWQQPFGRRRPRRVIFDSAVGALHWTALGTDDVSGLPAPPYPAGTYRGIRRRGWWLDARVGFGYQF